MIILHCADDFDHGYGDNYNDHYGRGFYGDENGNFQSSTASAAASSSGRRLLGDGYYYGYHNYHEGGAAAAAAAASGGDSSAAASAASSGITPVHYKSITCKSDDTAACNIGVLSFKLGCWLTWLHVLLAPDISSTISSSAQHQCVIFCCEDILLLLPFACRHWRMLL